MNVSSSPPQHLNISSNTPRSLKFSLFTVTIITYNQKSYLKDFIMSILNQDYSKIEIIIIDDDFDKLEIEEYIVENKKENLVSFIVNENNVNIGEGTAIVTCSLVIKDCQPWYIYIGIPVKKIKEQSKKFRTRARNEYQKINLKIELNYKTVHIIQ
ncbi:glycosyltransferase [Romboutsia sp.]|uniref:glycosyltransferase n=1 Tax=Romboutsia sp. TaxID=1965302 RepID=UPI003F2EC972